MQIRVRCLAINSPHFQSFANKNESLSKVCQTFCMLKQKVRQAFQTCQTCRFRNLTVNQTPIPSLPILLFSELAPIQHTLKSIYWLVFCTSEVHAAIRKFLLLLVQRSTVWFFARLKGLHCQALNKPVRTIVLDTCSLFMQFFKGSPKSPKINFQRFTDISAIVTNTIIWCIRL